jgi:predicted small metal-binding protein
MVLLQRPRKETNMAKVLKCNDLSPDCSFAARGNSDEDALKKVAEHAKTIHKMNKILLDVLDKARSAIRDESKARTKSGFAEKKGVNHSWW